MSPKGMSKPFFLRSGLAVNQFVYINKCIKPILLPFLQTHYPQGDYVFWPDLASSHYSKFAQQEFQSLGINYVPKHLNPANLPKSRPIEDFWGNLKDKVYEGAWFAKSLPQLRNRIAACIKKIDLQFVQNHMVTVKKRLDYIRRYGVD